MSYAFDQEYYLTTKLAQLDHAGYTDADGNPYTRDTLLQSFHDAGFTSAQQHYEQFGRAEGLNPTPYFDEVEYLEAKVNQLTSLGLTDANGSAFTVDAVRQAMAEIGMTPAEHYEHVGAFETDAGGHYLNPSNAFDANAYFQAKLLEVRESGADIHGHTGDAVTMADVIGAMQEIDVSPMTHYMSYGGAAEAEKYGIPMVQAVPDDQRVAADEARQVTGTTVPANDAPATAAPRDVTTPSAVVEPFDAGAQAPDGKPDDTGTNPDNPGTNPGTDTGTNPGTDTGTNPGTDPGTNPGTDPGTTPTVTPAHTVAAEGVDSAAFTAVADTFTTAFGIAATAEVPATPGVQEVQQISDLSADGVSGSEYTLTFGDITLTATPTAGNIQSLADGLTANLATQFPADGGQAAPFGISVDGDGLLTVTFTEPGAQTEHVSLSTASSGVDLPVTEENGSLATLTQTIDNVTVTDGTYHFSVNGEGGYTAAGANLAALAEAMQAAAGDQAVTIEATDNGISFTYTDGAAPAAAASITIPADAVSATVSGEDAAAQAAFAPSALAQAGDYILTVGESTLTFTVADAGADANALVTAITGDDEYAAASFEVATGTDDDGNDTLVVTMKDDAASLPASVTLTPPAQTLTAGEAAANDYGDVEIQHIGLADADAMAHQYTLNYGGDSPLTVDFQDTGLEALATALNDAAQAANAGFVIAADGTDGLTVTFTAVGNQEAISLRHDGESVQTLTATIGTQGVDATSAVPGTDGAASASSLAAMDTITGFSFGQDHIVLTGATVSGEVYHDTLADGFDAATFGDVVTEDNIAANQAALYTDGNDTYLYVNDGDPAFNADTDVVIKLVGVSQDTANAMDGSIFTPDAGNGGNG